MRRSIASCVVLGALSLGLPGSVLATQTIIFSDNFDSGLSSQWVDLSTALPWGGNPVGTSGFTTAGGYVTLTENAKNNTGYGPGKLSMFQALDFQFPEAINRSGGQTTITVEFRAKWDTGTLANEGSRLGLHFVHSYPGGGLDVNTPSKVTDNSDEWWAKPAYNMRIRTVQQDSLLMYGGGPTAEGEFEYDAGNGYWLPGFSSAPGGASPQNFVPGVEGAGVGNYSQTQWKDYRYVLKPDRQELWYDGILVGTQMLGDITDPAQTFDNNGYQKQFDTIEGVRLFFRGQAGRAQAFVDDFVIMVDQPATILDDLFWDPDAGTPGAQGGTGTWSAAGNTFWNGVTNVSFSNDPTERVIFGTSNGTVTLQTDVTAQELVIESNTYTFSASAARQFNTDLTIADGAKLIKAGSGVLTLIGDVVNDGQLEFSPASNNGMLVNGNLTGDGEVRFVSGGSSNRYEAANADRGLHFTGGGTVDLANDVIAANFNHRIILGARDNTTVNHSGFMKADQSNDVIIFLRTGGRMVFGADSHIDLINGGPSDTNTFYTRQFWVDGDGTGIIEFAEDFLANRVDLTPGSEVAEGLGSVRLSNATMVTNSTQSIPGAFRLLSDGVTVGWNGHIVFENNAGGRWLVQNQDQVNQSGVWGRVDFTVETQTNLTHVGTTQAQVGGYTSYNAFQIQNGATMVKTGAGSLIFDGEQAYSSGATMIVQEGAVIFNTDPTAGVGQTFTNGQHLNLQLTQTGSATVNAATAGIRSLSITDSASLEVSGGSSLAVALPITQTGGLITGSGTIVGSLNTTAGTIAPGSSAGQLSITGNLTLGSGATLAVELLDNSAAGITYDQLAITGQAALGGTLEVATLPGFSALPGDRFEILTYGSSTGAFDAFSGIEAGVGGFGGLWLELEQSGGSLELVANAMVGDANLDGSVDDLDLAIVQANLGDPTKTSWLDGNFSGTSVSLYDAYLLFTNYGSSISPPTVTAIPEPASLALLGLGSMLLGVRRKR